jgi:hypothetical protein
MVTVTLILHSLILISIARKKSKSSGIYHSQKFSNLPSTIYNIIVFLISQKNSSMYIVFVLMLKFEKQYIYVLTISNE